ncbi:hypothetical protein OHT59_40515 [Streptomyces sp. NBC_00243]|uniref:hypothetical protein n=1 Tax=Streptomyces sp. NBC_00243 TaxID=2975688 RepID=UPI002DDC8D6D|nr:hypothetical protein [Streptomyces sp. NBC_00243]WRZ24357.1 hypothetical protein OHT59_40515 [Streptomyces sp. NBC_00243]
MTFIPRTRFAVFAALARTYTRPHRTASPDTQTVELAHWLLNKPVAERRAHLAALDDLTLLDVLVVMDMRTGSAYELWRDTPSGFAEDILGLTLTDAQRAVLDAAAGPDVRRVAARVPHPDNHQTAAALMAWTALVSGPRPYNDCPRVAVSFAQYRQTATSVWRCLARFIDNASLPGNLDMSRWSWWADDLEGPQHVMAFAVWNTDPYAMGGLHNFVAVVADADKIASPDMRATMNFLAENVHGGSRIVALGNAVDDAEEWFTGFEACDQVTAPPDTSGDRSRWIRIGVLIDEAPG